MSVQMVIDESVREAGTDPIFRIAGEAEKRVGEIGSEKVINSTLGALMDDEGGLVCFETVYDEFRALPNEKIAAYAGISGIPDFLERVQDACFKSQRPAGFIQAAATPGGTGAVRNAVRNYSEEGDAVLIPDWYWAPYDTIAEENDRTTRKFSLFNDEGSFNLESYKENFDALYHSQNKRVLSILNTPAHNPTGFSVKNEEWLAIIDYLVEKAADPAARLIILCDIAYIDFAGQGDSAREFMQLLSGLPENILVLYAFSASKSYTMYGLRNGALICVAATQAIADEFAAACSYSNRGTWSNGTRGAMETLAAIQGDAGKKAAFEAEQAANREMLQKRAAAFMTAAKEVGLPTCTYDDGFFISIPCENPVAVSDALMEKNVFIVALAKGLRFAPCAVSEEKCKKAPGLILEALREYNNK